MNLEGILAIGGKPGLYKLVAQGRGGIIVQSLIDDKRAAISSTSNVSALQDIAIYTYSEEVPLTDVLSKIAEKENCGKTISHKSSQEELKNYMAEILPDYDQERVYGSDLKKLFQWYNILQECGLVILEEKEQKEEEEVEEESGDNGEE